MTQKNSLSPASVSENRNPWPSTSAIAMPTYATGVQAASHPVSLNAYPAATMAIASGRVRKIRKRTL